MKYFDFASTTPVHPEVQETYRKVLQKYYVNSESLYPEGLEVNKLISKSRRQVADLLRVNPNEIIFTSGASESNNMAIKGYCLKNRDKGHHVITTVIEHSSVLNSYKWLAEYCGFEVSWLKVNEEGKISIDELKSLIRDDTILVSVMYVNNESGAIQPLEEVKQVVKGYRNCALHVDCVQALGKIDIDLKGIDMASFSAHKIYGIKGSGILYKKQSILMAPLISGGVQEQGLRGGTVDSCAAILWGKTLRLALSDMDKKNELVRQYHDYMVEELRKMDDIVINSPADGLPYIINFSCLSIQSEVMMNALHMKGYCVSAQSTCESNIAVSHVISRMFRDEKRLKGTIRVSLSATLSWQDVRGFIADLKEIIRIYG